MDKNRNFVPVCNVHLLRQSVTKNFTWRSFVYQAINDKKSSRSINRILEAKFILRIVDSTVTTTDVYSIVYTWSFFSWSSSKLTYSSQYSEKGDRISKNSGIFEQALKLTFLGEGKKLHAIKFWFTFFSSCVLCMFYYFFFMINWNVIFFKRAGFSFCWNSFRKVSNELRSRTLLNFYILLKGKEKFES